jgi:hypothetical protein
MARTTKEKDNQEEMKKLSKLQELRAKSPWKTKPQRKGKGRPQKAGTGLTFNTPISRKLNIDRAESYAVEFSIKRAFGT